MNGRVPQILQIKSNEKKSSTEHRIYDKSIKSTKNQKPKKNKNKTQFYETGRSVVCLPNQI